MKSGHLAAVVGRAVIAVLIFLLLGVDSPRAAIAVELRPWTYTSPDGQKTTKFEAEFLGLEGVTVVLQGKDGKRYKPALVNLAEVDIRYVEELSKTGAGEFIDWIDGLGNKLKVRYAGVAGQVIVLITQEGGSLQVPWARLSAEQKAYVTKVQKMVVSAHAQAVEAARNWRTLENGMEMVALNADQLPSNYDRILRLEFSADNKLLFSVSARSDGSEKPGHWAIWSVPARWEQATLQRSEEYAYYDFFQAAPTQRYSQFFAPTSTQIWWLDPLGMFFKWDASSGRLLTNVAQARDAHRKLTRGSSGERDHVRVECVAWSPDAKTAAIFDRGTDGGVWLVNAVSGERLERMGGLTDELIDGLQFSPDGQMLVGRDDNKVFLWNLVTRQHRIITYSGKFVGVTENGRAIAYMSTSEIALWSVSTGEPYKSYVPPGDERRSGWARVSPVGSLVAIAHDRRIFLDDWASAERLAILDSQEAIVNQMAFSSDGSLLATGDVEGRIKLWKVGSLTATKEDQKASSTGEVSPEKNSRPVESPVDESPRGQQSLFDGTSLAGWSPRYPDRDKWLAENGEIVYDGNDRNYLITESVFQDFDLHLEFLLEQGTNSGVYLRGRYEVQLNDSYSLDVQSSCGAVWDLIAPERQAYRGAGAWNTLDIRLVNREVSVVLNGVRIISSRRIPHTTVDALDTDEDQPGPIMLQGYAGLVRFRKVWIRPLDLPATNPPKGPDAAEPAKISKPSAEPTVATSSQPPLKQATLQSDLTNSIGMKFKLIPKGKFLMGSPPSEEGSEDNERQHEVTISRDYYLGVTEVTQAQYLKVMGKNPSHCQGDEVAERTPAKKHPTTGRTLEEEKIIPVDTGHHPVELVSWEDAVEFCRRLSAYSEEKAAGRVYRLPTEAEWEYACRAGSKTASGFGDGARALGEYAWYDDNSGGRTHAVGQKKPNAWGLYDMHGNVWEWCGDWYGEYPKGAVSDPKGSAEGSDRVIRGSSRNYSAADCRSADRNWYRPENGDDRLGFRVATVPSGK